MRFFCWFPIFFENFSLLVIHSKFWAILDQYWGFCVAFLKEGCKGGQIQKVFSISFYLKKGLKLVQRIFSQKVYHKKFIKFACWAKWTNWKYLLRITILENWLILFQNYFFHSNTIQLIWLQGDPALTAAWNLWTKF